MTKLQKTIGNISNDKSSGAIFARMCSWRFYVDYLIHFVCSNSRHGTHSPFVYGLVDKVFYGKRQPGEPRDKVERLIARLISRFQPSAVYTLGDPLPQQLDFVVVKGGDPEWIKCQLDEILPNLNQHSVIVFKDIYRSSGTKRLWREAKEEPAVTVTIDLFYVGLIFFHSGQARENFRIRF